MHCDSFIAVDSRHTVNIRHLSKRIRYSRPGFFEELRRIAYEDLSPELRDKARQELLKAKKEEKDLAEAAELAKSWHRDNPALRNAINEIYREYAKSRSPRLLPLDESDEDILAAKREQARAVASLFSGLSAARKELGKYEDVLETIQKNRQQARREGLSFVEKKEKESHALLLLQHIVQTVHNYQSKLDNIEEQKDAIKAKKLEEIQEVARSVSTLKQELETGKIKSKLKEVYDLVAGMS